MISDHNRDTSPDHPTTPNHTKSQHNTKIKLGYVALGLGRAARVWVTFDGAIKTTAVLTDPETGHLTGLLGDAQGAR